MNVKEFERVNCPNGRGAFVYLPETDLAWMFEVPGNAFICTKTYNEGARWANGHGADFAILPTVKEAVFALAAKHKFPAPSSMFSAPCARHNVKPGITLRWARGQHTTLVDLVDLAGDAIESIHAENYHV